MKEIIQLVEVESISEDIEKFYGMIFKVINGTFEEDFPDRSEVFYISRKQNKKLFFFLMDNFRDNTKVSYDFIKKELKRVGRE